MVEARMTAIAKSSSRFGKRHRTGNSSNSSCDEDN